MSNNSALALSIGCAIFSVFCLWMTVTAIGTRVFMLERRIRKLEKREIAVRESGGQTNHSS